MNPPTGVAEPPFLSGLSALGAGSGELVLRWTLPPSGFEAALFLAFQPGDVYTGPPFAEGLTGDGMSVGGLTDGVQVFAGLGVRAVGTGTYEPAGTVLLGTPGAPIYVDASASATGADGTTPATAFPDLFSGLLTAFSSVLGGGSGNLHVRNGTYDAPILPVFAGVHIYGGFDGTFDLDVRDPDAGLTIFRGLPGAPMFDVQGGDPAAIFDGVVVDGAASANVGIDVNDCEIELRSTAVVNCTDRGIRMRNGTADCLDVTLAKCRIAGNGADGLSAIGPFDMEIDGCSFDSNIQEGMDLDDLIAPDGGRVTLDIKGSRFFGNGSQGLDVDLAAPLIPGPLFQGEFVVNIRGCRFELNGQDGCLIDEEFELITGYSARITVRESIARGNAGNGFFIDADGVDTMFLHRLLSVGNGGDGFAIASESQTGFAVLSSSISSGNQGAGIRASRGIAATGGNKPVFATQSILAGNFGGGIVSEIVDSSATSSIAYLQPNPWSAVSLHGVYQEDDPFAGTFQFVPEAFLTATAWVDVQVTVGSVTAVGPASVLELADDDVMRNPVAFTGSVIDLDSAPDTFRIPGLVSVFGPGVTSVVEDWDLPLGSPAAGTGFAAPGAPATDPGVWGAPSPGFAGFPDEVEGELFFLRATTPSTVLGVGALLPIELHFNDDLDPTSVLPGSVRVVTLAGGELAIGLVPGVDSIVVDPPAGGWGTEALVLEIHRGLRSLAGVELTAPLAIPLQPF